MIQVVERVGVQEFFGVGSDISPEYGQPRQEGREFQEFKGVRVLRQIEVDLFTPIVFLSVPLRIFRFCTFRFCSPMRTFLSVSA